MEKVLQILAVFVLLMLVIGYSIHSRDRRFREYYFFGEIALPLQGDAYRDLLSVPILPGGNGGMAIDRENQLSFRAGINDGEQGRDGGGGAQGRGGAREELAPGQLLLVSDDTTGREVAAISLEEGADAILFDQETRLLYCCSGEGGLSVIRQTTRESYKIVQHLTIPKGCSDMALDMTTGRLYLRSGGSVLLYTQG